MSFADAETRTACIIWYFNIMKRRTGAGPDTHAQMETMGGLVSAPDSDLQPFVGTGLVLSRLLTPFWELGSPA